MKIIIFIFLVILGFTYEVFSQISPGELAKVHAQLEGMSKCTQCHTLGDKVSNSKCLACHTEIKERVDQQKGYHASTAVKGKECASCHNDHHGKNFQIIRFDEVKFEHNLTGFKLEGAHSKKKCMDCHKPANITNLKLKSKTYTYMGLSTECVSCHVDYHQKTLSTTCSNCHGQESFKPAVKFNHASTKFPLLGSHQKVDCEKCHKIEVREGKKFQIFNGIQFNNCTSCHKDVHDNKFGQNCSQCHSETSFHNIKGNKNFDHNKTGFKLEGKHATVNCQLCHKTSISDPLKHDKCNDCHLDYHKSQFAKAGKTPDCSECHTVKGFSPSNYTIEKHNQSKFALQGSHIATPCFECHKKSENWSFRQIGQTCVDCHKNIHKGSISQKYYPNENCNNCHIVNSWNEVKFDHSLTNFKLTGAHIQLTCKQCHFTKDKLGLEQQKFSGLPQNCANCHTDKHNKQFEKNGVTDCNECHVTDNWKVSIFDHSKTAFKLDGKHENVACNKCHKLDSNQHIIYKINNFKCESCHLQ
jgi:hypothetical protein